VTRRTGAWLHRSARRPRKGAAQHDRVVAALIAAALAADQRGLARMLHPGVVLTVDGGGVVPAPVVALEGASEVGSYLAGVLLEAATSLRIESVNGVAGVVVCRAGRVTGVLNIRVRRRLVLEAWLVANPEKLAHWNC